MVKIGHDAIAEISYSPPSHGASGVEVVSIAELHRRMLGHGTSPEAQRPDFHLLLTVDHGTLGHMVDFHDYVLADGAWLWVRAGQVQRFGDASSASGSAILFPPDALFPMTVSEAALDDPFGRTLWTPSDTDAAAMRRALDHLAHEFRSSDLHALVRSAILHHLLVVLLLRLTSITAPSGAHTEGHADTFLRFRAVVEKSFAEHRDVAYYARQLGYSSRTLTRAAVDAAGVGAKEFIDRRVMLEAKRLLAHTDDPAAAIAMRIGFPDASNFVKYFALRADVTPTAFRRQFRSGTTSHPR